MSAAVQPPPLPVRPSNPWKGLHFYTEEDQSIFFGREREAEEFHRLLKRDILSVLFARSGLGKTSLLRAGIVPRLREESFFPVVLRVGSLLAPSPAARRVIECTLAAAAEEGIEVAPVEGAAETVSPAAWSGTLWEFFHSHECWGKRNDLLVPVLIFDQFEEVFTLGRNEDGASVFLEQVADLAENRVPQSLHRRFSSTGERLPFNTGAQACKVVFSVREDFVPKLDSLRPIVPAVMRNRFALEPLSAGAAMAVIQKAGGKWVSTEVARQIVSAVAGEEQELEQPACTDSDGAEIEPAYLSVMCHELFRRMVELGRTSIGSDLVAAEHGNILTALYERSFEGLEPKTRIFVEERLLTASGFRGTAPVAEAMDEGVSAAALESLVDRRLLRFEDRLGTTHVELSHDLLTSVAGKSRTERREEARREAERQRQEELQRRLRETRRRAAMWAISLFMLLAGIGLYLLMWKLPYQSYGRAFTKRWGTVHPVGELPRSAVAHRFSTLRFTRQGWFGPMQKVEAIDANGQPTSSHEILTYLADPNATQAQREKESRYDFVYDRNGRIVYEVAWDRFGRMTWGLIYAPQQEGPGSRPSLSKATFLGSDGYPQPQSRSQAEYVEIRYDNRGFEEEQRFTDRDGRPMPGPDGAYGRRWKYDKEGRLIRQTSLNSDGKPMVDQAGNAGREIIYDDFGNEVEERALDPKGQPTLTKGGVYRAEAKFDKWGRVIDVRAFDLSGTPCRETEKLGAHRGTLEYDDRGNPISIKLYDVDGKPTVAEVFEFPAHEKRAEYYDDSNRSKSVAYFGAEGEPVSGPEGWHSYRIEYDKNGFVSATEFFGTAGEPVNQTNSGTHRWERKNDEFGQPLEERCFDSQRKPIATLDGGYHVRVNEYDKAGNRVVQSYFDVNNRPCVDKSDGAHRYVQQFDRFRNITLIQYFGVGREAINNKEGFHRVQSDYNEYGAETDKRWYDKDGSPCNGPDNVHFIKSTYDKRGMLTQVMRFSTKNEPAADKNGIHQALFGYNEKRQETRKQYFGLNRKPAEDENGNHFIENEFDEWGRLTKVTQLRADGNPNLYPELRVATIRIAYSKKGQQTEVAYHDERDRLVIGPYGYSKRVRRYHPNGGVEQIHYGADGSPALNPLVGYAIQKLLRGKDGGEVESFHGPDGALISCPQGYAEARRRRSDDGTLLEEAYFRPDGAPGVGPGGYHRLERNRGIPTANVKYFDTSGREMSSVETGSLIPIIFIAEILGMQQPAAKAGLHVGDVLWRYGNWSFPEAFEEEQLKVTPPDETPEAIAQKFLAERHRLRTEVVPMIVLRNGKPVRILMPPLPEQADDMKLDDRRVPRSIYNEWKDTASSPAGTASPLTLGPFAR